MPRGRPPTNPIEKKLAGNPGKRAIKEPVTVAGVLVAPPQLSKEAKLVWLNVIRAMPAKTYASTDVYVLTMLCEAVADYWVAAKRIEQDGRYIPGSTGANLIQHPAVKDKNEQARLIYTFSQRLYLDPIARQSLFANDPNQPADDDFAPAPLTH